MESIFHEKLYIFFVTLLLNYVHEKCVFPYVKRYIASHHILRG